MNRAETTAMLSALVEKRLDSRTSYWAREVSFDRGTPNWRRIDYVGFKPYTPNYAVEPISVELVFSHAMKSNRVWRILSRATG